MKEISGHIVDALGHEIYDGTVVISDGRIMRIRREAVPSVAPYILPGFVDSHVHIESTLLTPEHFASLAVAKGVVSVVTDPHEIANVLGMEGIDFMIDNGGKVHFHFNFCAPSCVPCTPFETSGAVIGHEEIASLLERDEVCAVAEFMNAVGVLSGDPECLAKLDVARKAGKPVDGHAPGLGVEELRKYAAAGISTDHECISLEEAQNHLDAGICVQIREGSASCDYPALSPLLARYEDRLMFCTDDKYADELAEGYIDRLVSRSIKDGYPLWNVLNAACVTPVRHYGLKQGLLQEGDGADFITVDNLTDFNVISTFIDGREVFSNGVVNMNEFYAGGAPQKVLPDSFARGTVTAGDIRVTPAGQSLKVISAADRTLRTGTMHVPPQVEDGNVVSDIENDVLKMVVCNRYSDTAPQMAFIHGFKLRRGAFASSIAHDSHNIVAVGTNDADIVRAVNKVLEMKGGLVLADGENVSGLPLPVAGLMSDRSGEEVAQMHCALKVQARDLGCGFDAPFMTLSFMALPVIPDLKLTDKGLFDANRFGFTGLFD